MVVQQPTAGAKWWRPFAAEHRRRAGRDEQAQLDGKPFAELIDGWADIRRMAPLVVCEIEALDGHAYRYLDKQEWRLVRKMIIGAFEAGKAAAEDVSSDSGDAEWVSACRSEALLEVLTCRRTHIEKHFKESAVIRARKRYAQGLFVGAVASIVTLFLVGLVMKDVTVGLRRPFDGVPRLTPREFFALRDSLACIGGGSLGAALSVLFRIGAGQHVPYRSTTRVTAVYRMILGWIFAAGILCLVKGHIVALFPDPTEVLLRSKDPFNDPAVAESFFFWVGVGILAGFNERWVKRLISQPTNDQSR
jgi:hypothetical protein